MPAVIVTDSNFGDLEIERQVFEEANIDIISRQVSTAADFVDELAEVDGLLVQYASVPGQVFQELPELRVVGRYGIGVDNIDIDSATEHGVPVVNVPDYCENEVPEHAIGLMFACLRQISTFDTDVKAGEWDWKKKRKPIHRLRGSTLGLVGFGNMARNLAVKIEGLGLDVLVYDPYLSESSVSNHKITKVDFETLIEHADIISIHSPLTEETESLFNTATFRRMKDTAILINTARGAIIDPDALYQAFVEGELYGAGLDVFPEEPPTKMELLKLDQVVATPHAAWYSEDSLRDLRRTLAKEVTIAIKGKIPKNVVNFKTKQ